MRQQNNKNIRTHITSTTYRGDTKVTHIMPHTAHKLSVNSRSNDRSCGDRYACSDRTNRVSIVRKMKVNRHNKLNTLIHRHRHPFYMRNIHISHAAAGCVGCCYLLVLGSNVRAVWEISRELATARRKSRALVVNGFVLPWNIFMGGCFLSIRVRWYASFMSFPHGLHVLRK